VRAVAALVALLVAQPFPAAPVAVAPPATTAASARSSAQDARPSFSEWLAALRAEAIGRGIKPDLVDAAFAGVEEPLPVILERDRAQAETVFSLEYYLARRLTSKLIVTGREAFGANRELLEEVGAAYAVPPRLIAAIWGVESNYGRFSGVRPTVAALATLAWDPRRATFFRGELFDALEILNRGDIDLPRLKGSWAGAMGQVQFMPSSYLKFAEDYDGDGRRDIWSDPADVFASIANYLSNRGWTSDASWGREVSVSEETAKRVRADVQPRAGSCQAIRNMTVPLAPSRWQELGVRLPGGKPLPKGGEPLSLVSGSTRHFLVTSNYDAILDYNCSHSYAITVALLGDAIASTGKVRPQPAPKPHAKASKRKR
jgi:peptidoglycan lytic transglycosylase B